MHNDDFASSDHYRVGNSKLHTANAISLQNSQSVEQQPIKYIGQEFGESLNTLTLSIQNPFCIRNWKIPICIIDPSCIKLYFGSAIQFAPSSILSQKSILDQKPSPQYFGFFGFFWPLTRFLDPKYRKQLIPYWLERFKRKNFYY